MREKILIAEDESNLRKLLVATLGASFQLFQASSGEEAFLLAQRHKPDVILLDIMMPGTVNGLDVCRKIKQDPALCTNYIILLTALGQKADRECGAKANADAYVVKPFSPLALIELIENRNKKSHC